MDGVGADVDLSVNHYSVDGGDGWGCGSLGRSGTVGRRGWGVIGGCVDE